MFYPRSLAGATMVAVLRLLILANFNPRSLTGATFDGWCQWEQLHQISIHAPLRERLKLWLSFIRFMIFQSTLPCGSDAAVAKSLASCKPISIHAPLRERRFEQLELVKTNAISIHAPLRERLNISFLSIL